MRLQHYSFDDSYDVSCDDRRQKSRQKNLSRFLRGTAFALGVTTLTTGGEFIYDTLAGRYMGLAMKSERPANVVDEGLDYLTPDYYTPANVRRLGR